MAVSLLLATLTGIAGLPELAFLGGIGSSEIVLILVVMLLLFGPKQLPELAKTIASTLRGIRRATDDMKEEIGLDELVNPRPPRPRNYRPKKNTTQNLPPSLQDAPPSPATSQDEKEETGKKPQGQQIPSTLTDSSPAADLPETALPPPDPAAGLSSAAPRPPDPRDELPDDPATEHDDEERKP